jgi:hypothetical protein
MLALALMSGAAAIQSAAAGPLQAAVQKPEAGKASDLNARRHTRHPAHDAERTDDRFYYYDRPTTYRPYPYVLPAPFFLGFGFGPW